MKNRPETSWILEYEIQRSNFDFWDRLSKSVLFVNIFLADIGKYRYCGTLMTLSYKITKIF